MRFWNYKWKNDRYYEKKGQKMRRETNEDKKLFEL
jgi:hypothetical protein